MVKVPQAFGEVLVVSGEVLVAFGEVLFFSKYE